MKKYRFLWILTLSTTCLFSLVSCGVQGIQGEQGEKGDKGDAGEKGEKGDTGAQGSKGEKGDTGNQGEKGDKGDKGEKGDAGSTGPTGPQGKTAWSNTILPSEHGYVTVNVGSATLNEEITFTMIPNFGYSLKSLTLNDDTYYLDNPKLILNEKTGYYECTVNMVENGFVVQAEFVYDDSSDFSKEELSESEWRKLYKNLSNYWTSDDAKITFGSNEWELKKSKNYLSDDECKTSDRYLVVYLNRNGIKNYYFTSSGGENIQIKSKYYLDGNTRTVQLEEDYLEDENAIEKNWDFDYVFNYALICPDFSNYYDQFKYDSSNGIYYYSGSATKALSTYKILDLTNKYIYDNETQIESYQNYSSYYDIKVKIRNNHLAWIKFKTTDTSFDDNEVLVEFIKDNKNYIELPKHKHIYSNEWVLSKKAMEYIDEEGNKKYAYGHYHECLCLDEHYYDFRPHTFKDGICTVCQYNSRYVDEDKYKSCFYRIKDMYNPITAIFTWDSKKLVYKWKYLEDKYLFSINYDDKEWILEFDEDVSYYDDDAKITIYKKENGSWSKEEKTYKDLCEDKYSSYCESFFSKNFIIPNIVLKYNNFEYSDGVFNLKSDVNSIQLNNILFNKTNNDDFDNINNASYSDISLIFKENEELDTVLKQMKFKISNNELFKNNEVTLTFNYSDVEITIPEI